MPKQNFDFSFYLWPDFSNYLLDVNIFIQQAHKLYTQLSLEISTKINFTLHLWAKEKPVRHIFCTRFRHTSIRSLKIYPFGSRFYTVFVLELWTLTYPVGTIYYGTYTQVSCRWLLVYCTILHRHSSLLFCIFLVAVYISFFQLILFARIFPFSVAITPWVSIWDTNTYFIPFYCLYLAKNVRYTCVYVCVWATFFLFIMVCGCFLVLLFIFYALRGNMSYIINISKQILASELSG